MKAITIIQPYAELIIRADKPVENRTWTTSHRGPTAIHAGVGLKYGGRHVRDIASDYGIDPATLVFGAVIGVANLIDCVVMEDAKPTHYRAAPYRVPDWAMAKHPCLRGCEHVHGPVLWVFADPVRWQSPLVIKGKLGLWNCDTEGGAL